MRPVFPAVVLVLAVSVAACSSTATSKPSGHATSASGEAQISSPTPSPSTSSSPTYDASWTASCGQFDAGMRLGYQDITQMQTGHITAVISLLAHDIRISKEAVATAAADAPSTLAGHESDVAKSLDTLAAKIDSYTSGTLDVAYEVKAVHSAESTVESDCYSAGYSLKNMIADS